MSKNETTEERVGYLLITATVEEVPDIRVTVTQKGLQEYYSTLTENVVLDALANARVNVSPTQAWEPEVGASWILEIGTEGVEEPGMYIIRIGEPVYGFRSRCVRSRSPLTTTTNII